jgi:CheY-like chemotaxis protein
LTPRLLIVDDEPDILQTLADALPGLLGGAHVVAVGSGEEALRVLEAGPAFDAIVSDERLPGIAGSDVLAWARRERPAAVRVLMTAFNHPDVRRRAREDAAVHLFVEKPLRLPAFVKELKAALDRPRGGPSAGPERKGA